MFTFLLLGCHSGDQEKISREKMHEKVELENRVNAAFDSYQKTQSKMIEYVCTRYMATQQKIMLSKVYLAKEGVIRARYHAARESMYHTLSEVKHTFGRTTSVIDDFLKYDKKYGDISPKNVTRGFCHSYEDGLFAKIAENIRQYQTQPVLPDHSTTSDKTIYLNNHYQITNITVNIKQNELPLSLNFGGRAFPLKCHYALLQPIYQAAALNHVLPNRFLDEAIHYFYQHQSPQVDAVLQCELPESFSNRALFQTTDTYPWYQPSIIGSPGKWAAGDALSYVNQNCLIVVFGHEPCVCNYNDAQQCQKIKSISREYQRSYWDVLENLKLTQSSSTPQKKRAIDRFIQWSQVEIKKDFCLIDQKAMKKNMNFLLKELKK